MATIFDRILTGEIPCYRVHEDAHTLAFLDINPLSPGHTLVIPKESKAFLDELSDESAAAIGRQLPRIGRAAMAASGAEAYNVLCNRGEASGQEVMHVHFHVIPKMSDRGLIKTWRPGSLEPDAAAQMLQAMHQALARL